MAEEAPGSDRMASHRTGGRASDQGMGVALLAARAIAVRSAPDARKRSFRGARTSTWAPTAKLSGAGSACQSVMETEHAAGDGHGWRDETAAGLDQAAIARVRAASALARPAGGVRGHLIIPGVMVSVHTRPRVNGACPRCRGGREGGEGRPSALDLEVTVHVVSTFDT